MKQMKSFRRVPVIYCLCCFIGFFVRSLFDAYVAVLSFLYSLLSFVSSVGPILLLAYIHCLLLSTVSHSSLLNYSFIIPCITPFTSLHIPFIRIHHHY